MLDLVKCPICGNESISHLFDCIDQKYRAKWRLWRCFSCELVFLNPQPEWYELKLYYSEKYEPYHAIDHSSIDKLVEQVKHTGILENIKVYKNDIVLEIGPGSGSFLFAANRYCNKVIGVEPSPVAAKLLSNLGLDIFYGFIDDFVKTYRGSKFTLIYLSHVIEHLFNPLESLKQLLSLLSTDGRIIVKTPNSNSWGFHFLRKHWFPVEAPRHLMLFNLKTFEILSKLTGLKIKNVRDYTPWYIAENEFASLLQHLYHLPAKLIYRFPSLLRKTGCAIGLRHDKNGQGAFLDLEFCRGN